MVAYDYSQMADLYDLFCRFDGDLDFFRRLTDGVRGPLLELMAGTGRVSSAMANAGVGADLVCLDLSPAMLAILRAKVAHVEPPPAAICGDATTLPFPADRFELVLLPFQGLSELIDRSEQTRLMAEAARVMRAGGRFVCTAHNPAVRGRTIDRKWHHIGNFEAPDGGHLELALWTETVGTRRARGRQRVRRVDDAGELVEQREVALEFSLPQLGDLLAMADDAGLRLVELAGDYGGTRFDPAASPCIVAVLEKPA